MAAEAPAIPFVTRQSSWQTLRQVLMPVGQILMFVVGSAVILGGIVLLLGLLLPGRGTQANLLTPVLTLLPFVIIDGLVLGFLYATIALGYTMV